MKSLNFPYTPRIDQLRWLAATIVFLYHFHLEYRGLGGAALTSPWLGLITEGHTGVGLFFTLSGFLFMQIALHQKQIVYGDFIRNRFLRIFPLFFTIFLVATSIGRDSFQPQDVFYLLSSNLGFAPTSISVVTGAAWCISLEFMFYLLFPFLSRFAMERGVRYLLSLLGLMLFFKLASYSVNPKSTLMYFSTFVGRFDQFLIGMLAAMLVAQNGARLARMAAWLLPLAAALVVANSALQASVAAFNPQAKAPFWIAWSLLESGGWACLIVTWVAFSKALPGWLERTLNHGGKVSFSFYLLHMAVLHLLAQSVGMLHPTGVEVVDVAVMLAGAYGATWALATLSYHTIEEPFLRMRRGYGLAKPAPGLDQPYHAHVYCKPASMDLARAFRQRLVRALETDEFPGMQFVGTLCEEGVGPHPDPQFEVHFMASTLPRLMPLFEGCGLTVLVHPLTMDDLADHTTLAHWIGTPIPLDLTTLDPLGVNQGMARFGKADF